MEPVADYNPKELEERILKFWEKAGVRQKTLKRSDKKLFSFLEGPPTANAPPALHHVEVRVFKDLVNRYNFMRGYAVPRKAGWDCHGLPVEVQVEKKLKLNSKKEIHEFGVDKFVEECRNSVFSHIKEWDQLTERMAYWVDLEEPYVTMDNDYIESVWWSLKQIHDKNLLYEGYKVVPYCPRCGTPLSSHEVAQGYKTVKEETVIVALRAKDKDYSFLVWTTTPWTLLSNLALAVAADVKYAVIQYLGEKYILAKNLAEKRFPEAEILEELTGKDLVGLEYHPLFSHFVGKLDKPAWKVVVGDFVTTDEGTGIVHIAPAFGEDDYNVGKENDLPLVNPIDEDGKFTEDIPELMGMFAKDADAKIIRILDEMGAIVAKYPYEHDYPFCWRCQTPLLYYAMKSWFIRMEKLKDNLMKNNNEVSWYPDNMKSGRFGNWLENIKDWSLSRNRFWGTPLPIWTCACGKIKVIGSKKELIENAIGKVDADIDLHRPYVDAVKISCECGKEMVRVEYVIDCWYDSGAATFAQFHYPFENEELFEKSFPYDFISEATDQTRGWFYTLLAISTLLFDKPAYKNVVVGGLLLDEKGEKMSSSKGNILDPWDLFNTVGADAVRLQMCQSAPWNVKRFGVESIKDSIIPVLRTLWNCYSFTVGYMILDEFEVGGEYGKPKYKIEDKWISSVTDSLVKNVAQSIQSNEYHIVVKSISEFIVEDLSRWYIKIIRDRLWLEDDGKIHPEKLSAYMTLIEVFGKLSRVLAPVTPFIAEEVFMKFNAGKSVHLAGWPTLKKTDSKLELEMNIVRKIFEACTNLRQDAKIKLRHPIRAVTVTGDARVKNAVSRFEDVIKKQLNTKMVEYADSIPNLEYNAIPDFKVLGPAFGKDTGKVANLIAKNSKQAKKAFEDKKPVKIGGYDISPEMIAEVRLNIPDDIKCSRFGFGNCNGIISIDSSRDESLLREALARDIIRNVQELRKKNNLNEMARIKVTVSKNARVEKTLDNYVDYIKNEVRADSIEFSDKIIGSTFEFEGDKITVGIK